MISPRQARQKSVARTLRALAMMESYASWIGASQEEQKEICGILNGIEKRVRDEYREYQRSYGSKHLIADKWKSIIDRDKLDAWAKEMDEKEEILYGPIPF